METKFCQYCGNGVAAKDKFCFKCGMKPYLTVNYCRNCGRPNTENYLKCNGCGTLLIAKQNPIVFYLLSCFPLAPFHRFYAGHIKAGIISSIIYIGGWVLLGLSPDDAINEWVFIVCMLVLLVWWVRDCLMIWFRLPSDYLNADGVPIG